MTKILRSLTLVFAILIPTAALASDAGAPRCCAGHCCPDGCPFCHHH